MLRLQHSNCHSERSEESPTIGLFSALFANQMIEMFRFAQHDRSGCRTSCTILELGISLELEAWDLVVPVRCFSRRSLQQQPSNCIRALLHQ